jgi:pyruvate ferredoxin oxidoreductase gamma subunit
MKQIFEIVIIGRGGQGAKTASEVLAAAALGLGKHIQAFSEYGAERAGAPITSFIRISDEPITIHTSILEPDLVVVMDDSLLGMAQPAGECKVIVNTVMSPDQVREEIDFHSGKVYTVDCTGISVEVIGRNIPNTPTLSAMVRIAEIIPKDSVVEKMREKLESKIGKLAMDKNIESFNRAYDEVKEG